MKLDGEAVKWNESVVCLELQHQRLVPLRIRKLDVEKGQVLIEISCSKPLVFSSILEFEEGCESKVMFEYKRLEGFCTLCFRMTHDVSVCYKSKPEIRGQGSAIFRGAGNIKRTRTYKGAVNGSNRGAYVPAASKFENIKGTRGNHGIATLSDLPVNELEDIPTVETNSAKKVRRPLFQDQGDHNVAESEAVKAATPNQENGMNGDTMEESKLSEAMGVDLEQ